MRKKTSAFVFSIRNHTVLKAIYSKIFCKKIGFLKTPEQQNAAAKYVFNYKYDCVHPKTFNEFLGWLKFNYSNDLWKRCADKLGMKEFLREIGFGDYLPKVLGIYQKTNEIDLSALPDKFVLKTNHDSGSVFICDKEKTNFSSIFLELDSSLKRNYSSNGEWVYKDIEPKIFAEEYIPPFDGDDSLIDYKLFIYDGKFKWGFSGQNRETDCRFCVFEDDFSIQDVDYIYLRPRKDKMPRKPMHFDEMVRIAEGVGRYFAFVRVDFYETKEGPRIGELTFFSQSGLGPFTSRKYDLRYGDYFSAISFEHSFSDAPKTR